MSISLRWIASFSASCLHAAEAIAHGKSLSDRRLIEALSIPAVALRDEISKSSLPAGRFWRQLLAVAHHFENNRELATTAIRKVVPWQPGYETLAGRLADRIAAVETAVQSAVPGVVDELANRSRPIREQWEARGPGLLQGVARLTDERVLVESAEVVLVLPALGGGGAAHLSNNSVRFEAVLTNNVPQLPEVARLAWLLAQLQCDLPNFSDAIPADQLPLVGQLALLPPILQAAQDVELTKFTPETTALAITAWQVELSVNIQSVCESLLVWWQTYQETRPDWKTALAALQRMIV
jgi:hypothetical protein